MVKYNLVAIDLKSQAETAPAEHEADEVVGDDEIVGFGDDA